MVWSVRVVVAVGVLAALASAHKYSIGRCSAKPPMQGFQPAQMEGKWYMVAASSTTSLCITLDFTPSDGGFKVEESREWSLFRMVGIDTDVKSTTTLTPPDPANPAVLEATDGPTGLGFLDNADVTVLDTDYTTYAAMYECKDYLFFRREELAILSRQPTLDSAIMDREISDAGKAGIPTSDISHIGHQGCVDQPDFEFDIGDVFRGSEGNATDTDTAGGETRDPELDIFTIENPTENEIP